MKLDQRIHWDGHALRAELHRYEAPTNWGIILFEGAQRYATATVNPAQLLPGNQVVINTGDGQEGIDQALASAGIISQSPVSWIQLGYVRAPVHRLLVKPEESAL